MKKIKCFIATKNENEFTFDEEFFGGAAPPKFDRSPGGLYFQVDKNNEYEDILVIFYSNVQLTAQDLLKLQEDWRDFCIK